MTIKYFLSETRRFLKSPQPEVLCITGKWGVGKTFGWNSSLRSAIEAQDLALGRYCYVSLFGKNSVEDVKMSVVENTTEGRELGGQPTASVYGRHVDRLKSLVKGNSWLASLIPGASDFVPALNRLLFMDVRKQIICLDDLERIGSGIELNEILGIISELKERKSCKVVLLLNRDAMSEEDQNILQAHLEKVADAFLEFIPTSAEAVEIALDKKTEFYECLRENCLRLGLINIRVIKKIEQICHRIEEAASSFDRRIMVAAVHTVTLAGYAHLQPREAPSLDFIRNFNSMSDLVTKYARGKGTEDPDLGKKDLLRRYGFTAVSELDAIIIDGIERGAFHDEELRAAFARADNVLKISDKNRSFEAAWDLFRGGFNSGDDQVLDALVKSIQENYDAIRPAALSQTLLFLKDFGREKEAQAALDVFVSRRDEAPEFWNLNNYMRGEQVVDPDVRDAFARKFAEVSPPPPNQSTVLKDVVRRGGWSPEEIAFLASLSVDDYIAMFKNPEENEIETLIPASLYFRDIGNATPDMRTVTLKAEAALYKIAQQSRMSARRVKFWGLDIEIYEAASNPHIDVK